MFRRAKSRLLECGAVLNEMSKAHARFEIEASKHIFTKRKKLLIVALTPVMVALLVQIAAAAGLLPEKIPILGGSKAYMPSYINDTMFFGSILVGLIAGLITGVIGAGGGYILTPALMSFGVRGIMAVGTDQFHLFAKAIMGTAIHKKLGNVNFGLAAWFVLGSVSGATAGGMISRAIFQRSPAMSDALISAVYVFVLGILGVYAVADWLRLRRCATTEQDCSTTTEFARKLQAVGLTPRIKFDQDIVEGGRSISVYPVILCGLVVGFVAAIMGVGGGFLTFPMFVYGLGVSTFTTVGTDILQIIFTTSYSSIFQYAIYGFVFYTVAVGMLLGSLVGVQIGAMVTKMVKGSQIRAFYALTILAGFSNRLCALPRKLADLGYLSLSRDVTSAIETFGTVVFFAFVGAFGLWILTVFVKNIGPMRASEMKGQPSGLIAHPGKFWTGIAGLVLFAAALAIGSKPIVGGKTALVWADGLFNQLAKNSAYYVPDARKKAESVKSQSVSYGIHPRDPADERVLARVLTTNGVKTTVLGDGRVRITEQATLASLSRLALADADLAFKNKMSDLQAKYHMPGEEVIYYWWTIFDGLTRRYIQEGDNKQGDFTKLMTTKVLEPAYNFRGIKARHISCCAGRVTLLLGFYVIYTLWYGVAILLVMEGLGVCASVSKEKKET